MGHWLALTLILLVLFGLTAAATAVRSVSRIWLRHWAERRLVGHGVAEAFIDRPQRLLHGASAGATLLIVTAGLVIGSRPSRGWTLVGDIAVFAVAMLILGQYVPRAVGRRWAHALVPVLLPALRLVTLIVWPITRAAQLLAPAFRREQDTPSSPSERDEIEDLLREGELEGIGEPEEIDIITGVVQFGEKRVREVMTPRTDVFAADIESDPREMALQVAHAGYSRVPVYRGSLDEVLGLVHALDVLAEQGERWPPLREIMLAPESKRCSELLFDMLRRQLHMSVVLDEFGGTAGIVTLEDLLEELVGDIRDEHDEPASADAAPAGSRALLIAGTTELEDVARRLDVTIPTGRRDGGVQTFGGAVVRALGRVPAPGERFRLGPIEATVVESDATRVLTLLVQRGGSAAPVELALPGA
jgi:putative hemolysin